MATINSLTAATALGSADKFLIETPLGPKSISGSVLKEQITADSAKKGKLVWEDDTHLSLIEIEMPDDNPHLFLVVTIDRFAETLEIYHTQMIFISPFIDSNFTSSVMLEPDANDGDNPPTIEYIAAERVFVDGKHYTYFYNLSTNAYRICKIIDLGELPK